MHDLLDANVWLALSAPAHVHYARARRYWDMEAGGQLVACRVTALALLRLLTNARILGPSTLNGEAAWSVLAGWLAAPELRFAADPEGLDDWLGSWGGVHDLRGGSWTDTYLAAFAMAGGCRLVTFDHGFARFRGLNLLLLQP